MSTVVNPPSVALSTAELRKRAHVHSAIDTHERAMCLRTGVLDVDLLKAAHLSVPSSLEDCAVVGVAYAARTLSNLTQRTEAVFHVFDVSGELIGSYFSSAFKSFAR